MVIINVIKNNIEIFDKLFMKIKGVIKEISKSKIRNRIVSIKKFTENGIFIFLFSLNPHSKFILIVFCFLLMLLFIVRVMIRRKLTIKEIVMIRLVKFVNFFSF